MDWVEKLRTDTAQAGEELGWAAISRRTGIHVNALARFAAGGIKKPQATTVDRLRSFLAEWTAERDYPGNIEDDVELGEITGLRLQPDAEDSLTGGTATRGRSRMRRARPGERQLPPDWPADSVGIHAHFVSILTGAAARFRSVVATTTVDSQLRAEIEGRAFRFLSRLNVIAGAWSEVWRRYYDVSVSAVDLALLVSALDAVLVASARREFPSHSEVLDHEAFLDRIGIGPMRAIHRVIESFEQPSAVMWLDRDGHVLAEIEYREPVDLPPAA